VFNSSYFFLLCNVYLVLGVKKRWMLTLLGPRTMVRRFRKKLLLLSLSTILIAWPLSLAHHNQKVAYRSHVPSFIEIGRGMEKILERILFMSICKFAFHCTYQFGTHNFSTGPHGEPVRCITVYTLIPTYALCEMCL
jgi:hypothetical protein